MHKVEARGESKPGEMIKGASGEFDDGITLQTVRERHQAELGKEDLPQLHLSIATFPEWCIFTDAKTAT
jgi:hypothetical protein